MVYYTARSAERIAHLLRTFSKLHRSRSWEVVKWRAYMKVQHMLAFVSGSISVETSPKRAEHFVTAIETLFVWIRISRSGGTFCKYQATPSLLKLDSGHRIHIEFAGATMITLGFTNVYNSVSKSKL